MFTIRRVDRLASAESLEFLGSKPKFWFTDQGRRTLFKADDRGTGEDWSEKIACHLCELLGLPHVHYELAAEFFGSSYVRPGVICESFATGVRSLVLGNQLLLALDPRYPATASRKYKVKQHTVAAVADVICRILPPLADWMTPVPAEATTALDVFVGYLMLDAWIGNQDRHHENWGAISSMGLWLAPTFDHAAGLARNLTDEERQVRLTTRDRNRTVKAFALRARSAFYSRAEDTSPLSTFDAFWEFAGLAAVAARAWLNRLEKVDDSRVVSIIEQVPTQRMTNTAQQFALELLRANKQSLLESSAQL